MNATTIYKKYWKMIEMIERGHPYDGVFLVLDGCDGTGKSTQFRRICDDLRNQQYPVCEVREPGGTMVGERIREILLDPIHKEMTLAAELFLYTTSRAQLTEERIEPALKRGEIVVADRFFSSTHAYQYWAGGMKDNGLSLDTFLKIQHIATKGISADLTAIFDVTPETAATRLNPLLDRMEQKGLEFHNRVREGYFDFARVIGNRARIISTESNVDTVYEEFSRIVFDYLKSVNYRSRN